MADPTKFLESCLWALIDANDDAALTEVSLSHTRRACAHPQASRATCMCSSG